MRHKRSLFFILMLFLIIFLFFFVSASEDLTHGGTDGKMTLVTEKQFFDKKGKPVNTVKAYDEVKRK